MRSNSNTLTFADPLGRVQFHASQNVFSTQKITVSNAFVWYLIFWHLQIRWAECSLRNGFGLKLIHRFFNVPFLTLQVEFSFLSTLSNKIKQIHPFKSNLTTHPIKSTISNPPYQVHPIKSTISSPPHQIHPIKSTLSNPPHQIQPIKYNLTTHLSDISIFRGNPCSANWKWIQETSRYEPPLQKVNWSSSTYFLGNSRGAWLVHGVWGSKLSDFLGLKNCHEKG